MARPPAPPGRRAAPLRGLLAQRLASDAYSIRLQPRPARPDHAPPLGTIDCFSFPPAMAGGAKKKRVARVSKKKKNGRGRDVGADLTDDVLVDILSCVPIKSLYRCKSVCRRWHDLISNPDNGKKLP
nr:unnamed protein product [Digitaria exilis]